MRQVPLKILDAYQNNHSPYTVEALIDNNPTTEFRQGGRLVLPYDVIFDLSDYQPCIVQRFEYFDGNGLGFDTDFILVTPEGVEHLAFKFTGSKYNEIINVDVPSIPAAKLIIRTENNGGYPKWFRMYGEFTEAEPKVYPAPRVPLKNILGVNTHWWNFCMNVFLKDNGIDLLKYNKFMELGLTSVRNYGDARFYVNGEEVWAFNPVGQGWYEENVFQKMKVDRPEMVRWSVVQGQYDFVKETWQQPDESAYAIGTITRVDDYGTWISVGVDITESVGVGTKCSGANFRILSEPDAGFTREQYNMPSGTAWTVPAAPANLGFAMSKPKVPYKVGQQFKIIKGQASQLNFPFKYNFDRGNPEAWKVLGRTGFVFASRKGTNKNVPDYTVWKHGNWYRPENEVLKGIGASDLFEAMNEPNAHWMGWDDYLSGDGLGMALSMIYDGHKGKYPDCGVKNADPNFPVSTPGFATDRTDLLRGLIEWSKTNRGMKNGVPDVPFDIIQFHCYPSAGGQYSNAQGGLPPELGMIPKVRDYVAVSQKYLGGLPVWIGEWGYDVNPGSPQNAPAFGKYNAEQTRANWSVRSIFGFSAAGLNRSQWFRLYADYHQKDSRGGNYLSDTSTVQFSQMALLRQEDDAAAIINRTLVGEYFMQASAYGDYVCVEEKNTGNLYEYKFKKDTSEILFVFCLESVVIGTDHRPVVTENTATYNVPAGGKTKRFSADGLVETNERSFEAGSEPVIIELSEAIEQKTLLATVNVYSDGTFEKIEK